VLVFDDTCLAMQCHESMPVFALQVTGITDGNLKPRPVKTVAVLGGGLMGSGIATATLVAGMDVVLKEVNQKFLDVSVSQSNVDRHWSVLRAAPQIA
jgi:phage-related protein